MINLKLRFIHKFIIYYFFLIYLLFFSISVFAETQKKITIVGTENIDEEIIFSIINDKISDYSINNVNEIIKTLYETGNFKNIESEYLENEIILRIEENPAIENIRFNGSKRFTKKQIFEIFNRKKYFQTLNRSYVDNFIIDLKSLYASYGFNLVKIEYDIVKNSNSNNLVDLIFNVDEGSISKINRIYFIGNNSFSDSQLRSNIKTKQRNLFWPFNNINYKEYQVKDDKRRLINYYKKFGFKDVKIEIKNEFISKRNSLNVYIYIEEGSKYYFRNFDFDIDNFVSQFVKIEDIIDNEKSIILKKFNKYNVYDPLFIQNSKKRLIKVLNKSGENFFSIIPLERYEENFVDIKFEFNNIEPKYVNQINIFGNTRTKEKVIRRQIPIAEGDPFTDEVTRNTKINLEKLGFFKNVKISQKDVNNLVDLEINVEEKSTGEFQVGVALDSFEGTTLLSGLKEKNILGDGRELNLKINTSSYDTTYAFGIVEPYITNRDIDFIYNISYSNKDISDSSSYKLTQFNNDVGIRYGLTDDIRHSVILQYLLKDYEITDSSASNSVKKLGGGNAQININNTLSYNDLDSYIRPSSGTRVSYYNIFSPATNDDNGYIKNLIIYNKYYPYKAGRVVSFRSKIGNISSLQNKEIPLDDKFSLGGRWLRGFDMRGVGPRESRSSYIGGRNVIVSKFDFKQPLIKNSENPIDLNLFTDIGTVFDNKVAPTSSKESIRASYGFGFNLYSIIGPIGFSWAFPIIEEDYDIKRMFMFSVGNLN